MLSERRDFVLLKPVSSMTHTFLALIPQAPDPDYTYPDGSPWWAYAVFGFFCIFPLLIIYARHREARRTQMGRDSSETKH
jgi:hypothetical protein